MVTGMTSTAQGLEARQTSGQAAMRVLILDDEASIRRLLQNWVQAEGATVIEADTSEQALTVVAAEGPPAVALCDIRLPGKDGLWLAAQLRARYPETAVVMTTGVNEFDAAVTSLHAGVVDYLVKPFTRERLIQALNRALFAHKSRVALTAMDRELSARRAQITEAIAEMEVNSTGSLDAMLSMLAARDPRACDRAHRVAQLSVNIAMTLQIGEPRLSDIERAALLHNIGRLALPDALLRDSGAGLNEDERQRLREYPVHGHAMLRNVAFLAPAADIALAAHERWDGSGFPYGLVGESIPLGARIVGLADAFDALVTSGVSRSEALAALATAHAVEFDPNVLEALRRLQPASM